MKFYNSLGPNPQVVRMFAAESGMTLNTVEVDLMAGENRQDDYLVRNPAGQLPCMELDDGSHISEILAICEYLDEMNSGGTLIGDTPEERANTRMWTRRIDLNICEPLANGFRFSEGIDLFRDFLGRNRRFHGIHVGDELQEFSPRELVVQVGHVRYIAQQTIGGAVTGHQVVAAQSNGPRTGAQQANDHLDRRGLASAVGPQKGKQFAARTFER